MKDMSVLKLSAIGLLPLAVVTLAVYLLRNMFVAMLTMHLFGMIIPMVLFSLWRDGKQGLQWYSNYIRQQRLGRWGLYPLVFLLAGAGVSICVYVLSSCKTKSWVACIGGISENIAEFGFHDAPFALLVACAVYFPIVNPVIEELFWRVFMLKEIDLTRNFGKSSESEETEAEHLITASIEAGIPANRRNSVSNSPSWMIRIWLSALYASYHTIIVGIFLGGFLYGMASFVAVSFLGCILIQIFLQSSNNHGFYRAVFLHAGIDIGIVIALGDTLGWYSLI